jgi:hypothetical protein
MSKITCGNGREINSSRQVHSRRTPGRIGSMTVQILPTDAQSAAPRRRCFLRSVHCLLGTDFSELSMSLKAPRLLGMTPLMDDASHATQRCECGAVEGVRPQRAESRQSGAESITAALLAFEPRIERCLRERRGSMKVDSCSLGAADPAPAAHQRPFGEQRRLDRQDIVTRHVLRATGRNGGERKTFMNCKVLSSNRYGDDCADVTCSLCDR